MLELQPTDFLAQQLCENPYQIIPKSELKDKLTDKKKNKRTKITALLENIQNFRQNQISNKPLIDTECAKEFLEQFQIEKINRKRSKYQTIINRFKEKQAQLEGVALYRRSTMDLNLSKILAAISPSHDLYHQNRLDLIQQSQNSSPEKTNEKKKSQIVPKVVRKLGLLTEKERNQQNIDKQSYNAYMMTSQNKQRSLVYVKQNNKFINSPLSIVHQKKRILKTAQQSKSYLNQLFPQIQSEISKGNHSFIEQKNETFNKVQNFCKDVDEYAQQIQGEQLKRYLSVSQTMNKIKQSFQNWEFQMKDRAEILEHNLAEEIKQEVMGVKKKRRSKNIKQQQQILSS